MLSLSHIQSLPPFALHDNNSSLHGNNDHSLPRNAFCHSFSLLHVAAGMGQATSVKWLLSLPQSQGKGAAAAGLKVSAADNVDGATALHAAALAGSLECVELLLQHGVQ